MSRLSQLVHDLAGSTNDLTLGFTYNPASQIATNSRSNDLYAWTQHGSGTTSTTANGLNQLASWNVALSHDSKGNVTAVGTSGYGYSSENLLTSAPGSTLSYDPLTRLQALSGGINLKRLYDGGELIAEYNNSGALLRRFVHGPGTDEPLVWYAQGGPRRFLHADERGSIVSATDDNGAPVVTYRYDEYGGWGTGNSGRFYYTGQTGYAELGLYYFKARWYHPGIGRFLQPDPIGYGSGMNLYAYVGGDPVNATDPSGLARHCGGDKMAGPGGCISPVNYTGSLTGAECGSCMIASSPGPMYAPSPSMVARAAAAAGGGASGTTLAGGPLPGGLSLGCGADPCVTGRLSDPGTRGPVGAEVFHIGGPSPYVSDEKLPPYAHILRGRRVMDPRTGNISLVNIPRNYRLIAAPHGGGRLLVPPGWRPGSFVNVIRMQPAGTGSAQHNPKGYFVVYGQNGAALDLRTGQAVARNDPRAHNPWGGVLPPFPNWFGS